jgi:hypothetical protein
VHHLIKLPHRYYSHHSLNSFDCNSFVTTVDRKGRGSVFRDQELIHSNIQLPMAVVDSGAVAPTFLDGEPCIAIAGWGKGAGVYIRHAVTLAELRSLPYKEDVHCLCIDITGTKLFFGTKSGWIFEASFFPPLV